MTAENVEFKMTYLDLQAYAGVTKHMGGFEATNELLALCHIKDAQEALDVGCGIGVGAACIAKKYGCRVVGVDISEKMMEWSRQRAKQERVEDRIEFRTADVLDLPSEANRFDVVICESVLAFIEDKPRAIRELVRVVKHGGYVELNEALWIEEPPPEKAEQALEWGTNILTVGAWQALWEGSRLQDREVRTYQIDARTEVKSRIRWIGWAWILKAWYQVLSLYLKDPSARQFIKEQLGNTPREMFGSLGYGLFVGRK